MRMYDSTRVNTSSMGSSCGPNLFLISVLGNAGSAAVPAPAPTSIADPAPAAVPIAVADPAPVPVADPVPIW